MADLVGYEAFGAKSRLSVKARLESLIAVLHDVLPLCVQFLFADVGRLTNQHVRYSRADHLRWIYKEDDSQRQQRGAFRRERPHHHLAEHQRRLSFRSD
jgi:hypothetical protein